MNPASVLVLGGGPAGMSAALWLKNLGLDFLVLEQGERPGGMQNFNFLANDWVLGQMAMTGPMIAARYRDHLEEIGVQIQTGTRLDRAEKAGHGFAASYGGTRRRFDAMLIATGTRYRAAEVLRDVPGFPALPPGAVVYGPYAFADVATLAERHVLIVGGGDNAFENVRLLAAAGARPILVMRSKPRAQRVHLSAVHELAGRGRCRIFELARITGLAMEGDEIMVDLGVGPRRESLRVDRIHVLAGYEPNTAFIGAAFQHELAAGIALDPLGYISIDAGCRSSQAGIYAAGDVANPQFPCVVSALAQGALAAKTVERDLRGRAS